VQYDSLTSQNVLQFKDSLILFQGAVDLLFGYMEFLLKFDLPFEEEVMSAVKVIVLKKLQEKLSVVDVSLAVPQELKFKVEVKICIDFVKALLGNSELLARVFIYNDFTGVKRPLIAGLLNICVKVPCF
jgi:hypothetical protein